MRVLSILTSALLVLTTSLVNAGEKKQCDHASDGYHQTKHVEQEDTKVTTAQKTCPVMGGAIDTNIFVDHDGKRIYLCCKGCIETFKKDPATYLKELEELGEEPETITDLVPQKTCPVMGGAINTNIYVDHDGKRVYLCCRGCIDSFKKNPAKYLKKLEELGEKPEEI